MSQPPRYAVPWRLVANLTPHLLHGTQESIDAFTAGIVARLQPAPSWSGLEHLPDNPRFLLVANHYQRPGLWILHTAAVLTRAIRERYGPGDPPVRWVVTANWPPWRIGPWRIPSPGDLLLPRVAHALCCYPVAFAGKNPAYTAQSVRRILRDATALDRPIGLFPEGVAGTAGTLSAPLPGVDRVIRLLARGGLPVVPVAVTESPQINARFGPPIPCQDLLAATDAAQLAMSRVAALLTRCPRT